NVLLTSLRDAVQTHLYPKVKTKEDLHFAVTYLQHFLAPAPLKTNTQFERNHFILTSELIRLNSPHPEHVLIHSILLVTSIAILRRAIEAPQLLIPFIVNVLPSRADHYGQWNQSGLVVPYDDGPEHMMLHDLAVLAWITAMKFVRI